MEFSIHDAGGRFRLTPRRLASRLRRSIRGARTAVLMARLALRNRFSRRSVLGDADAVVCLTSYGRRLADVHLAIESVGRGDLRPKRLILWLDGELESHRISRPLRRLQARGLEIRGSGGLFGPHTKYYPYVRSRADHETPLVTCDDDMLYPRWWLRTLLADYERQHSPSVIGFRAHRIRLDGGRLAPYLEWEPVATDTPSYLNFITGVSGAAYPPLMLKRLAELGDAFSPLCPRADDIWLHAVALRAGLRPKQVTGRALHFPMIVGSQKDGLLHTNANSGGNDQQIRAVYTAEDLARLSEAAAPARRL